MTWAMLLGVCLRIHSQLLPRITHIMLRPARQDGQFSSCVTKRWTAGMPWGLPERANAVEALDPPRLGPHGKDAPRISSYGERQHDVNGTHGNVAGTGTGAGRSRGPAPDSAQEVGPLSVIPCGTAHVGLFNNSSNFSYKSSKL